MPFKEEYMLFNKRIIHHTNKQMEYYVIVYHNLDMTARSEANFKCHFIRVATWPTVFYHLCGVEYNTGVKSSANNTILWSNWSENKVLLHEYTSWFWWNGSPQEISTVRFEEAFHIAVIVTGAIFIADNDYPLAVRGSVEQKWTYQIWN